MKKQVLAALILAFLLAGCSGPAHPQAPAGELPLPVETEAAVEAAATECPAETAQPEPHFTPNAVDLYFPANPTTGYAWTAEFGEPGIAELDEKYFADGELGKVGAGGIQWYHIRGVSEGVTSVTFRYARSWENSALTTYVYRLEVDAKRNVLIWGVEVDPDGPGA